MRHEQRIPRFNKKIYRSPRERLITQTGGVMPRLGGRAVLYGQSPRVRSERVLSRFIKPALVTIGIIMLVQSLFQLPWLRISTVRIEGVKYVSLDDVRSFVDQELHRRRWVLFKNSNYFIFADERMRDRLDTRFNVDVLRIEKKFPNAVTIVIKERVSAFVVQTPDGYFTLGVDGSAVDDVAAPPQDRILIADERALRERRIPITYLEQATAIADSWQATVSTVGIRSFHLTDDDSRVTITTTRGFRVYLNPQKEVQPQLSRLAVYLQDRDMPAPTEYVDLRFDDLVNVR